MNREIFKNERKRELVEEKIRERERERERESHIFQTRIFGKR